MKNITTFALCIICALSLLSCQPQCDSNYVAINKTDSSIGFVVYYGQIKTTIEPHLRFEHFKRVIGIHLDAPVFKLSNLDDTTSIKIDDQKTIMIRERVLKTKTDTILYNSYSCYGWYTYQWVITKELLSVMEYDETLLAEFPEFYAK